MWLFQPRFTDGFVGSEALEGLESTAEVVCGEEVAKMMPELAVGFVLAAFDGRVLDRSVHPFDLPVGRKRENLPTFS